MTSFVVADQTQLNSALRMANGGDSIVLASSFKNADILLYGFNKPGGLTITSQDGGQASVASLKIGNSSNITVSNLDCPQAAGDSKQIAVRFCTNVEFTGLHVHGPASGKPGLGMNIQDCTGVSVRDCAFDHLSTGILYLRNNGMTLENNKLSYMVTDGFIGTSTNHLKILNNYFSEWRHVGDAHPDCIQLFTGPGDQPSSDITISGNVYNRGSGTPTQGIFIRNVSGKPSFDNLTITNNTVIGGSYNGISLDSVQSAVVSGNVVQGYGDQQSMLMVRNSLGKVVIQNNVASDYNYVGPNLQSTGNMLASGLQMSDLNGITAAIAHLAATGNTSALAAAAQSYLAGKSVLMAASSVYGTANYPGLRVAGSVDDILHQPDMAHLHGAQVIGTNVASLKQMTALLATGTVLLGDHATLTVQSSVADLRSASGYSASHSSVVTGISLIGDNTINASDAAMINALNHVSLGAGAHVVFSDWTVNFVKSLDTLENLASAGLITGVTLLDKAPVLAVTDTKYAADADALALLPGTARVNVTVAAGHSVTAHDGLATLDGSAGNAVLSASDSGNTLIGGAGDTLVGGLGKDAFVLHGHFGQETVVGFDANDFVQFDRAMVADFAHLQPMMHQAGNDVVIDFGGGDVLTLAGANIAGLNAGDFHFA